MSDRSGVSAPATWPRGMRVRTRRPLMVIGYRDTRWIPAGTVGEVFTVDPEGGPDEDPQVIVTFPGPPPFDVGFAGAALADLEPAS